MPGYDGTGPQGIGPNGRRMGPCGGGTGFARRGFWGFGRGVRGGGRGFWWANRNVGDENPVNSNMGNRLCNHMGNTINYTLV